MQGTSGAARPRIAQTRCGLLADPRGGGGVGGRKVRDIYVPDFRAGAGIKVPTRDFR